MKKEIYEAKWYKLGDHKGNLNNLLAILCHDGGHYQNEHGTKAAIEKGISNFLEKK